MKEKDRQLIVERIQKDIEDKKLLQKKYDRLQALSNNPQVKEYLSLLEEIKTKERIQNTLKKSIKETINIEFNKALNNNIKDKKISPCNHETWIYQGSFSIENDLWYDCEYELLVENETDKEFKFNRYMCLECGKSIKVPDWQKFESNHHILKNYNKNHDCTYYHNQYYQSLYNFSVEESKKHIIDEFNKDKELSKIKKLTKKIINE